MLYDTTLYVNMQYIIKVMNHTDPKYKCRLGIEICSPAYQGMCLMHHAWGHDVPGTWICNATYPGRCSMHVSQIKASPHCQGGPNLHCECKILILNLHCQNFSSYEASVTLRVCHTFVSGIDHTPNGIDTWYIWREYVWHTLSQCMLYVYYQSFNFTVSNFGSVSCRSHSIQLISILSYKLLSIYNNNWSKNCI